MMHGAPRTSVDEPLVVRRVALRITFPHICGVSINNKLVVRRVGEIDKLFHICYHANNAKNPTSRQAGFSREIGGVTCPLST